MWGASTRARIAEDVNRIRHWAVLEGSSPYWQLPNFEATWFIDPPYQHVPPAYRRGDIDCNTIDFAHLAAWVKSRKGQVIVCEKEGADWLPFKPFRALKAGTANARGTAGPDMGVLYTRS